VTHFKLLIQHLRAWGVKNKKKFRRNKVSIFDTVNSVRESIFVNHLKLILDA
jgi:hypothetical protein